MFGCAEEGRDDSVTSYMPESELNAICVKHKHQIGEGMVTIRMAAENARNEVISHAIRNIVRESIRRNIDNMLMKAGTIR